MTPETAQIIQHLLFIFFLALLAYGAFKGIGRD